MSQTRQKYVLYKIWPASDAQNWRACQFYRKNIRKTYSFFTVLTRTRTRCLNIRIFIALSRSDWWTLTVNDDSKSLICEAYYSMKILINEIFFQARSIFIIRFHLFCVTNTFFDFHLCLKIASTSPVIFISKYIQSHIRLSYVWTPFLRAKARNKNEYKEPFLGSSKLEHHTRAKIVSFWTDYYYALTPILEPKSKNLYN